MGLDRTDSLAVLEALAPDPGWQTDLALLSSYSVDLVAAAAVVVALAGEGDDHEQMPRASLARACERMRDRFRIVCQAGRVVVPAANASALVLADRWVREVHHDGNERSWHAKAALVRYSPISGVDSGTQWRLWVGSRNLTQDMSWDSALVAVGKSHRSPGEVDAAIARMGGVLAARAELPRWPAATVVDELSTLRWQWPDEVDRVISFSFWPDADPAPGFPVAPRGLHHMVAVGPFVDGTTAKRLGAWGSAAHRQLLTTPATLALLAGQKGKPLEKFDSLHQLDGAQAPEDGDADQDDSGTDQMVEVHRGLHAKLILARAKDGDHLWLGSANLTERAWTGANSEIALHLRVTSEVGDGLVDGLVKSAAEVPIETVGQPPETDPVEEQLDRLRNRIAACWVARLMRTGKPAGLRCVLGAPPVRRGDGARLSVKLFGETSSQQWPFGALEVDLPPVPLHRETELVVLELTSTRDEAVRVSWIARAVLDPPPDESRDRAVLARLMGPRSFLAWLRSLLDEVTGDLGDDHWPGNDRTNRAATAKGTPQSFAHLVAPSLEAVLRAWARDPMAVRQVDRALNAWAGELRRTSPAEWDAGEQEALAELARFESTWSVVREGLGLGEERP